MRVEDPAAAVSAFLSEREPRALAVKFGSPFDQPADFLRTLLNEYADGVFCTAMCRQQNGTDKKVANEFTGTNGSALVLPNYAISGPNAWKFEGEETKSQVQEHRDLIESIRAGKPLNEARRIAETTLTSILGREAAYTGRQIAWDDLMRSELDLTPPKLEFGPHDARPVRRPGKT